jgi:hypothetical protein
MGLKLNVYCDGPTCTQSEPFPEQRNSILSRSAPKDWLVIKIDTWRQIHKSAQADLCANTDSSRYFCSPRCLALFGLVWWLGVESVTKEQISLNIKRLTTDKPLDPDV